MRCQRQAEFTKSSTENEESWQCLCSADDRTCSIFGCSHFRTHCIQKEELVIFT